MNLISKVPNEITQPIPILFIHGAWHWSWCWDVHFMDYFAGKGYATYALDLSNHDTNQKSKSLNATRLSDYVEDVQEAINSIGQEPILVGHSMGGAVIQKFLEKYTCKAAICLASLPVSGVLRTTLNLIGKYPLTFLKANLTLNLHEIIKTKERTKWAFYENDISEDELAKYNEHLQSESYLAFLDMLFLKVKKNHHEHTSMLFLAGEKDNIFTVKEETQTAAFYDADLKVFKDAPHNLMLHSGWQEVGDEMLSWLKNKEL